MQLRSIAHVRSGDKGGTSDLTVVARDDDAYALLVEQLTPDAVRSYFDDLPVTRVARHEVPRLRALKFVLDGALGAGVTTSLALDAHGKCLSSCLLEMEIDLGDSSKMSMSEPDIDLGRGGERR